MVYINLLPIREIKKRIRAKQQLTLAGIVFVAVLAAVGAVWFYQAQSISALAQEITSLKNEKQRYNQVLAQIAKLEKDKELIENKIAVINNLQKTKALTVHILDEVARLTDSKRMWITSLDQSGMSLRLSGTALDNQTIAKYMETLKTSPYITDVNLISTSLTVFAGRNLKSFSLSCSLTMPEAAPPEGDEAITTTQK
ncbi:MAG: PilN domain-containing protein [Desulfobulbaceae bacterium]